MFRHVQIAGLIMLSGFVLTASILRAQDTLPTLDSLAPGEWTNISLPEEAAVCSDGSAYQFSVRPGDREQLMIYFQGGGACWNAVTCNLLSTFDGTVEADELAQYQGIFNFEDTANPIASYTSVFVSYCTGDVHIGQSQGFGQQFHGYQNTQAVLDWTYQNIPAPESLFITGSSAGGYGAIFHAESILAHYPDAQASVLGDASIGIIPPEWSGFEVWGVQSWLPELDALMADGRPAGERLLARMAEAHPEDAFGQYTNARDAVQIGFYGLQEGNPLVNFEQPGARLTEVWQTGMRASLMRLGVYDNFASYTAPGPVHTILARPEYHTTAVEGVRFDDWLIDFLAGRAETVACAECE